MGDPIKCINSTFVISREHYKKFPFHDSLSVGKISGVLKEKSTNKLYYEFYNFEVHPDNPPPLESGDYLRHLVSKMQSTNEKISGIHWTVKSTPMQPIKRRKRQTYAYLDKNGNVIEANEDGCYIDEDGNVIDTDGSYLLQESNNEINDDDGNTMMKRSGDDDDYYSSSDDDQPRPRRRARTSSKVVPIRKKKQADTQQADDSDNSDDQSLLSSSSNEEEDIHSSSDDSLEIDGDDNSLFNSFNTLKNTKNNRKKSSSRVSILLL
jgi:hypothetical protein